MMMMMTSRLIGVRSLVVVIFPRRCRLMIDISMLSGNIAEHEMLVIHPCSRQMLQFVDNAGSGRASENERQQHAQ